MNKQPIALGAALVLVLGGAALADGQPLPAGGVLLSEILGPNGQGSFKIKDKLFEIKAFVPANIFADQVTVVPFVFGPPNKQIVGFDLLGEWADEPGDMMPSGFAIEYNVTVLDPSKGIKNVGLSFNGNSIPGLDGFTDVVESIFDPTTGQLIDTLSVFTSGATPMDEWRLEDSFTVDEPVNENVLFELNIVKDFQIFSCDTACSSTSLIRQSFWQIPGPGALSLFAVAGFAASRRRR
jgi:hypothetical protein